MTPPEPDKSMTIQSLWYTQQPQAPQGNDLEAENKAD